MQTYRVRHRDRTTLFEGDYRSYHECIEEACARGVSLDGASFAHTDLGEINLDGISLENADFSFANLTGANLSEARLRNCNFENASLYNTCLSASDLGGCDFTDALFGGTDVSGASFEGCVFSGWPALETAWASCASMRGAVYVTPRQRCAMSRPPVVIQGALAGLAEARIALLDEDVLINQSLFSLKNNVWTPGRPAPSSGPSLPPSLYKAIALLESLRNFSDAYGLVENSKSTKS